MERIPGRKLFKLPVHDNSLKREFVIDPWYQWKKSIQEYVSKGMKERREVKKHDNWCRP